MAALAGAVAALALSPLAFTLVFRRAVEARYPPVGHRVDVGGGRLHVVETPPRGRPRGAALLVHGASGNFADPHVALAERLADEGFRVFSRRPPRPRLERPHRPARRRQSRPAGGLDSRGAATARRARDDRRRAFAGRRARPRHGVAGARLRARPRAARPRQPSLEGRRLLVLHARRPCGDRRAVPLAGRALGRFGEPQGRPRRSFRAQPDSRRTTRAAPGWRCCSAPASSAPTPRISSCCARRRGRWRRDTAKSPSQPPW